MTISEYLFRTKALRVSPHDKPFFYTSGKLGPFYINTHFLFGSEKEAYELLGMIDMLLCEDREKIPEIINQKAMEQYEKNDVYKSVMDELVKSIKKSIPSSDYGYISGGERRDWFFSYQAARILGKKHITIFKDRSVIFDKDDQIPFNTLHICDLITEASSFKNFWIPAIRAVGGELSSVISVVDRNQGGREFFEGEAIDFHPLIQIDGSFFVIAEKHGYIDKDQLDLIQDYIDDPDGSMRSFLIKNPAFIEQALKKGGRDSQKAHLLKEHDIYNLKQEDTV